MIADGTPDNDSWTGTEDRDIFHGLAGDDTLWGQGNADVLYGDSGSDALHGGAGEDFLYGGDQDDQLFGDEDNDFLFGDEGDDLLFGGAGRDSLIGGGGHDVLDGGADGDGMAGGPGDDFYFVDDHGDMITEQAGEGTDSVWSSIGWGLSDNVENLTLTGTENGMAYGNDLANILRGSSASNVIYGFGGNDRLLGGSSADVLDGGAGDDILDGGGGGDRLSGGEGSDVFTGTAASLNGATIMDFTRGDRIVISDATLAGFSLRFDQLLQAHILTYSGGSIRLEGLSYPTIRENAAPEGGVQITFSSPPIVLWGGGAVAPTLNVATISQQASVSSSIDPGAHSLLPTHGSLLPAHDADWHLESHFQHPHKFQMDHFFPA